MTAATRSASPQLARGRSRGLRRATVVALGAMAASAFATSVASAGPAGRARLVPANFGWKTDSLGFRWDLNQNGQVNDGQNDCFDTGLTLTVNGMQFSCGAPKMTPDGSEYVLSRNVSALQVTRRVKMDMAAAAMRYVEIVKNTGRSPVSVNMTISSTLGGSCQAVSTSSGSAAAQALGPKDSGVVAIQHPGQGRPSVVWALTGHRSKMKPGVNVQNNRNFSFSYVLNVPAGKTMAVMHTVAQRRFNGTPDAKTLSQLFRTYGSRAWAKDLPRDVRAALVNIGGAGLGAGLMPDLAKALEGLGLARGGADLVAFGEETRLAGTAACDSATVTTRYGRITVPFEDVAAVIGSSRSGRARVYTRDGRIYAGALEAEPIRFTMNSGLSLEVSSDGLDVLLTHAEPTDGKPREGACASVDTFDGNRLTVVPPRNGGNPPSFTFVTPWGTREVALDELRWVRPAEGGGAGHVAALVDGSRIFGFLAGQSRTLETVEFGPQAFAPGEIRAIQNLEEARRRSRAAERAAAGRAGDEPPEDETLSAPHVVLTGGNVVVGYVDLDEVHVSAQGAPVPLPPSQIRSLQRYSGNDLPSAASSPVGAAGPAVFRAELWGGGIVVGPLEEAELPVRSGEWVLRVPVADIVDVFVPTPRVPDALRDRIARHIRDLGHPDWKEREKASRALEELGYVAKTQLGAALKESADPEVRRRAKALLDKVEEPPAFDGAAAGGTSP